MKRIKDYNEIILKSKPKVSISCITYNQGNYIGKTIEYFLNQKVNFPVEILIHDDASSDNTQNVILSYTEQYPNIIKPILQTDNKFSKGAKCIHATFNFNRSKGDYIATCEGDDYWISEDKLLKQVEFLENNPEYTMASHEVYMTNYKRNKSFKGGIAILLKNLYLSGFKHFIYIIKLFLFERNEFWKKSRSSKLRKKNIDLSYLLNTYHKSVFIPTLSIVCKGDVFRSIPKELMLTPSGHKEHIFWAALHGKLYHSYEVLGQYNQQPFSLTQTKIHRNNLINPQLEKFEHLLKFYSILSKYANEKQKELIKKCTKNLKKFFSEKIQ